MLSCARVMAVTALFASLGGCGATPPKDAEKAPPRARPAPPPPRLAFGDCAAGDSVRFVSGGPRATRFRDVFGKLDTGGNRLGGGGGGGAVGLGTIGRAGSGYGRGSGLGLRGRGRPPRVRLGQSATTGSLDKNIIRRTIRRQLPRIRTCYERKLIDHPGLAGKAVADFIIDPSGKVSRVAVTGFDEVGPCLERAIAQIIFPKPRGGGIVKVRYPFVFRGDGAGTATEPEPKPEPKPEPPPEPPREAKIFGVIKGTRTTPTPLAAHRRELAACLAPGARGVAVVELELGAGGAVTRAAIHGALGDGVSACFASAGRRLRWSEKPGTYRCPLAFGETPPGSAPGLDITERAVRAGGADLATIASISSSRGGKIDAVYDYGRRARGGGEVVSGPGPLVVRPAASTPMVIVSRVTRSLASAGAGWALAAGGRDGWRLLREAVLPAVPTPISAFTSLVASGGGDDTVSIYVGRVELWVGASDGERHRFGAAGAGRDWKSVTAFLTRLRQTPALAKRVDFEIAADGQVRYRDFVAAVDAARRAGFTDFGLVDTDSLTVRFFQ